MQANASTTKLSINLCDFGLRRVLATLKLIGLVSILTAPMQSIAQDEEDWWFDVEVIAFKRNTSNTRLEEDFKSAAFTASSENAKDLISLSLFQGLNSLVYIQNMLFECSLDANLYTSESFTPENNPIAAPEAFVAESEQQNSFASGSLTSDALETENSEDINTYPPIDDVLTPEERFAIMFDPNNCSSKKQALAKNVITYEKSDKTPVYLERPTLSQSNNSHLLADDQLALIDFAKKLFAQRDISPLSHIAWRQQVVFGEENASYYRVYAGEKLKLPTPEVVSYEVLKEKYDPEMNNIIDQNSETFFAELKQQLDEANPVNWDKQAAKQQTESTETSSIDDVWELDGRVKVFLNYINRVPYLHIESEFQFHEIQVNSFGEAEIEQYPFKQRRRIVSKQIHYFDHPKMGLVIRLQRYEKPEEVENEDIY
ncbi:MAG: hypothetical protein ACI9O6_001451 [Glaciecola sp.]|jgi:hypothetical protein